MPIFFKTPAEVPSPADGVLSWEDNCLVVEYERSRFLRSPRVVRVDIPLEEIDDAVFKPRFFSGRLTVRLLYLDTAKKIDWCSGLELRFVIPRSETGRVIDLIDAMDEAIELEMRELDLPIDDDFDEADMDEALDEQLTRKKSARRLGD